MFPFGAAVSAEHGQEYALAEPQSLLYSKASGWRRDFNLTEKA
jgi:hypothetical protein